MLDILKTIIADFHSEGAPDGVIPRDLDVPLDVHKIISIIGPRRCGKTWYLYSLINRLKKDCGIHHIVYINFEDERLQFEPSTLQLIPSAYQQLYPDTPLDSVFFFFDEIQEAPGWEKFVRRLSDQLSPHVFLTGSSAKLLSREIAGALRGRTLAYTLLPYSFREFLRALDKEHLADSMVTTETANRASALFDRFMVQGGYPEVIRFDEAERVKTLQSYFEIMLYRDIVDRFRVRRPHLVKDFARRLVALNAQLFSVHKYYRELKSRNLRISKDTLYEFTDHFTDAYFALDVNKYDPSESKQAQALKKYYINDTGLVNACSFVPAENMGSLLETQVLLERRKRDRTMYYFSAERECDFIVADKGSVHEAIQVCHEITPENRRREIQGLETAMKRFGLKHGTIVTRHREEHIPSEAGEIHVIPAWKWCLSD